MRLVDCIYQSSSSSGLSELTQKSSPIKRTHLSSGQPYGAGPKASENPPKDALKLRRSGTTPGTIPRGSLGGSFRAVRLKGVSA